VSVGVGTGGLSVEGQLSSHGLDLGVNAG
jgi:hypothetical protein